MAALLKNPDECDLFLKYLSGSLQQQQEVLFLCEAGQLLQRAASLDEPTLVAQTVKIATLYILSEGQHRVRFIQESTRRSLVASVKAIEDSASSSSSSSSNNSASSTGHSTNSASSDGGDGVTAVTAAAAAAAALSAGNGPRKRSEASRVQHTLVMLEFAKKQVESAVSLNVLPK